MNRPRTLLALSAAALLSASAAAKDLLVPAQFATIQAAVDAASPGDKVRIADGVYDEAVLVHQKFDLALKGDDGVFVRMIWVNESTKVSVKEVTYTEPVDAQLLVTTSTDVDVRFSTFQGGATGVLAFDSKDVNVRDSDFVALQLGAGFSNCQQSRIAAFFTLTDVAAHVVGGSANRIEDCPMKNAGVVVVESAPLTTVRSNTLVGTQLAVFFSDGVLVDGNTFKKVPSAAIHVLASTDVTVQGNRLKKSVADGIVLENGGQNLLFANTVAKSGMTGIRLLSAGNAIQQNKVKKSGQFDLFDHTNGQNFYVGNSIGTSNL